MVSGSSVSRHRSVASRGRLRRLVVDLREPLGLDLGPLLGSVALELVAVVGEDALDRSPAGPVIRLVVPLTVASSHRFSLVPPAAGSLRTLASLGGTRTRRRCSPTRSSR